MNRTDALVGLLSEPAVPGTSFGQTLGRIIMDQYARARDGDRFWYENVYSSEEIEQVKKVTMKTLFERNFNITNLPAEVFLAPAECPSAPGCPITTQAVFLNLPPHRIQVHLVNQM